MVEYKLVYTKQAQKDAKKISRSNLKQKAIDLLDILKKDPFRKPPEYEALVGDLQGAYSRRINIQHRLVYQVYEEKNSEGHSNVDPLWRINSQHLAPLSGTRRRLLSTLGEEKLTKCYILLQIKP